MKLINIDLTMLNSFIIRQETSEKFVVLPINRAATLFVKIPSLYLHTLEIHVKYGRKAICKKVRYIMFKHMFIDKTCLCDDVVG